MKKLKTYFILLLIILGLCIADFSFPGMPWDSEIPVTKIIYHDIAIDFTVELIKKK